MVFRARTVAFILSSSLLLAGLIYLYYLQAIFPYLVPFHGAGERFSLDKAANYTFQMPWHAYSRLHITVQANETMELYINNEHVCRCVHYDFVIEPDEYVTIILKSNSPVQGKFTAWQETPSEKQMLASGLLITGILSTVGSIVSQKRSRSNEPA